MVKEIRLVDTLISVLSKRLAKRLDNCLRLLLQYVKKKFSFNEV